MRTRTVCAECFQPVRDPGFGYRHTDARDRRDCAWFHGAPMRVVVVRVCDVEICDRLADVFVDDLRALCSGHALGAHHVGPHAMTGRAR